MDVDPPDSPTSSRASLSPVPSIPSPVNRTKDPDFLPPDLDLGAIAPAPKPDILSPVERGGEYEQKIVSENLNSLYRLLGDQVVLLKLR